MALLRAQEQAQADQTLAQALGQARGQDIGLATTNTGYLADAQKMNLLSQLQSAQMASDDELERLKLKSNIASANAAGKSKLIGGLLGAGASMLGGGITSSLGGGT
jgi:hypothetical protein